MEKIAELAGVHRATLHRHFPVRGDLISSALAHALDEGRAIVERIDALEPGPKALLALARAATEFGNRHWFLVGESELLEAGPDPIGLGRLMASWQKEGFVRDDVDPVVLAAIFTAIAQALSLPGLDGAQIDRIDVLQSLFAEGAAVR